MTQLQDTPTHRYHMQQMSMQQIKELVEQLQKRRAAISVKIKEAKNNSKIARALEANKQFGKLILRMERSLAATEIALDTVADNLNKARALFLEMSDGEVLLEKEVINGPAQVEHSGRRTEESTVRSETYQDHHRDAGTDASAAPATDASG